MTEAGTVSSEVEVGVEPATAFTAFTEEMDLWWVRGPINFWSDGGRVVAIRCEPGVGGRIVEVLDGPDVLERARITVWEPPGRLGWASSIDDVQTEVRFAAVAGGTRVIVEHTIPAGGSDRGGTSWSRVVPNWFAAWCAKRDQVPHEQIDLARISLGVSYARPAAAGRFLRDVFGFAPEGELPEGPDPLPEGRYGHPWIELRVGNAAVMVFPLDGEQSAAPPSVVPWVYVDDLEDHFARVKGAGATIVEELHPLPGSSLYVAEDLEGNRWTFLQARRTMR
jgi:uncharacterized glyoxalase superfamily protein PhnB/uncharacterized protein YndB with AHSA1/START domain